MDKDRFHQILDKEFDVRIVLAHGDRYLNGVCDGLLIAKRLANLLDSKKRGKWLPTTSEDKMRCSVCDRVCLVAIYPWFGGQAKYCPACGVKMELKLEAKILEDEIWEEFDSGLELLKSV